MYNGLSQVYLSNQKAESISIQRVNVHIGNVSRDHSNEHQNKSFFLRTDIHITKNSLLFLEVMNNWDQIKATFSKKYFFYLFKNLYIIG